MNKSNPSWSCPSCAVQTPWSELIVDEYMQSILVAVGSEDIGESIQLQKDGTWALFQVQFDDHSESDSEEEPSKLSKRPRPSDRKSVV